MAFGKSAEPKNYGQGHNDIHIPYYYAKSNRHFQDSGL